MNDFIENKESFIEQEVKKYLKKYGAFNFKVERDDFISALTAAISFGRKEGYQEGVEAAEEICREKMDRIDCDRKDCACCNMGRARNAGLDSALAALASLKTK